MERSPTSRTSRRDWSISQAGFRRWNVDRHGYLLGTRYLTARDTTWILEYYRNGTGFSGEEMEDFFGFVNQCLPDLPDHRQ